MGTFRYEDILSMPYPNPEIERDFPDRILRAAQFAPYAALTGHDEAIEETARSTAGKIMLDEYTKEEINRKLNYLRERIADENSVSVTYFEADKLKSGGKYITKSGVITKVREFERNVELNDGTVIAADDIYDIEILT